jgi:hypothetical protein
MKPTATPSDKPIDKTLRTRIAKRDVPLALITESASGVQEVILDPDGSMHLLLRTGWVVDIIGRDIQLRTSPAKLLPFAMFSADTKLRFEALDKPESR